jgi:hypothetical protein
MSLNIIKPTLRLHKAAARWNALCTVLLSLKRLETTALLQGKFPCSAAWLMSLFGFSDDHSYTAVNYCNVPDPLPKERVWLAD